MAELERLQLAHDMGEVRSLLAGLRRSGLGPNLVHYNVAIDHAARRGDAEAALSFFADLLSQSHCSPSVVTFNATMRACFASRMRATHCWRLPTGLLAATS